MITEEIKKALEAATPGPWAIEGKGNEVWEVKEDRDGFRMQISKSVQCAMAPKNAHLIANAPTWLSQLLQEREQMVEALKEISKEARLAKHYEYAAIAEPVLDKVGELE